MNSQTSSPPQIFEYEYYQRLYDIEEQHWWAHGMRDAMVSLLKKPLAGKQKLRVLDIGCGTGYLMNFLPKHYSLDGGVVGLDISPHALKFCEQRGEKELILGSATEVPLESHQFDLIICIDTIQHLSPAGADMTAIKEFARLLKPGGLLYLRTNSAWGRTKLSGADHHQYRRYSVAEVSEMLRAAGLHVERATYLNCIPGAVGALREYAGLLAKPKHDDHDHAHDHTGHSHDQALGPGLKIQNYAPKYSLLNRIMYQVPRSEAALLDAGFDLPFGHSTGFVARLPG